MTVAVTNASDGPFVGNGSQTVFPFTFKAMSAAEVGVYIDGALVTSGFTVTLTYTGGNVAFTAAPTTGKQVTISSAPAFLQDVALTTGGPFLPGAIEQALDRGVVRDIYLKDRIAALASSTATAVSLLASVPGTIAAAVASVTSTATSVATTVAQTLINSYHFVVASVAGQAVSNRALLAAIPTPVDGQQAYLSEKGREGWFTFDASNLSAKVAIDTDQALYAAKGADTTGASGAWVRTFTGPICMTWFGWKGDGTTNASAAFTRAMSLISGTRGDDFLLPRGQVVIDGPLLVNRVVTISGHGAGSYTSAFDSGTRVEHPAGKSAFMFLANGPNGIQGAQGASIRDLTAYQPTRLSTTAVANYTAGSHTITITGGTNDYAANQVIGLEGAGTTTTAIDKVAAMTAGSNVATISGGTGNPGVYNGQPITIPGAGASGADLAGFVGAWSGTTITVVNAAGAALNAGTSVTNKGYVLKWPLIARIASVSGSTITLAQSCSNTTTVTGAKLRHADAGIYSEVVLHARNVECVNAPAGLVLEGNSDSGGGFNADQSTFYDSTFAGTWIGATAIGYDAQVCAFYSCNFAGPEISFLDASLIGNFLYGCHFAFNIGPAVVLVSSTSTMFGCYFEGGTSGWGNGNSWAFGCQGFDNANGWKYLGQPNNPAYGNTPSIRAPSVEVLGIGGGAAGGLRVAGALYHSDADYKARFEGGTGAAPFGAAGIGVDLWRDGNRAYVLSYNYTANAWSPLRLGGSTVDISISGTPVATWGSAGLDLASGSVVKVNGTQVVGARQTGAAAVATDPASTMALANDLRAKLVAHGLIS